MILSYNVNELKKLLASFYRLTNIRIVLYNNSFENFEQLQLQGTGFMQDGISYQSVSDEELKNVQAILRNELEFIRGNWL